MLTGGLGSLKETGPRRWHFTRESRAGGNCVGTQPPSAARLPGSLPGLASLLTKPAEAPSWSSYQAARAPEVETVLSQPLEHLDPKPTTSVLLSPCVHSATAQRIPFQLRPLHSAASITRSRGILFFLSLDWRF